VTDRPAVSLFSGCGGFCEGAKLAGFSTSAAVENDRFAAETYRFNFPDVPLFADDIRYFANSAEPTWCAEAHRFSHLEDVSIDLIFGGPPCQGYSQIGTRILDDPRNRLYAEYVRLLLHFKPRVFLMENVPNMLLMAKGRFKHEVLAALRDAGYANTEVRVVSASDFGVPQERKRAIFFGVRDDVHFPFNAGAWMDAVLAHERVAVSTVWDAIGDLPEGVTSPDEPMPYPALRSSNRVLDELRLDRSGAHYDSLAKQEKLEALTLNNHHTKEIQERRKNLIKLLRPGKKADSLPKDVWDGLRPEKWRRLDPDRPVYTILAQMHRDLSEWVHPKFDRWITVREAARLQSFHDGFIFKSSEWQMLKQIGNAVPPLLGRAICVVARSALDYMDANPPELEDHPEVIPSAIALSLTLNRLAAAGG
jgi:DNA (cytosine-5)-methyltransferase 1